MASATCSTISAEHISIPGALPAFMQSLIGLPNNPASLYLSINRRSLIIYVAPASTVNIIDLSDLNVALCQKDESALALKSLLETSTIIKVFFDARVPAKSLFERCDIKLANETYTKQTYIHEVQLMELALRQKDRGREWLVGLDKCIIQDSDLDVDKVTAGSPSGAAGFDMRILHLPVLWAKYHDQLTSGRNGAAFWISMIREATTKRLEVSRGEKDRGYVDDGAKSGWYKEIIDERTDSWNDDVLMDAIHGGEYLGGNEHWSKFKLL
ncbi:hypothetical protein BDV96DRAFT_688750 [Lophiotrema nucula]|uniref:3'-5' exonuclease domain-containing protein n=1 Tax=Lophiotrema nucula TaxID=690887 RepID=A0A6A5Z4M3_9PLEO|nr:hypothetical protein BDV96DRAFT_688750 [Lophiotrema nucula]